MTEPVLNEIQTAIDTLSTMQSGATGGALRRQEDYERLSKLEYIVADHHVDIRKLETALELLQSTFDERLKEVKSISEQTVAHLRTIKWVLIGTFIGMGISTIGPDKAITILAKLGLF